MTLLKASEELSAAQFQEALRQVPRYLERPVTGDPLALAVTRIGLNPAFAQSRLLTRILVALTYQEGGFRRAEIGALDAESLAMVISLMDAFTSGASPRAAWEQAVDDARAAAAGAGG